MLLRCRDLWDRCYVTCCYAADGVGWGGGWDVNVPCTSYITCCYAVEISGIVATSHGVTLLMVWGGVGGGMLTFLALRTLHVATLWGGGWRCNVANQTIRDYIYSFVWRCNVAKDARLKELGTLAKTCK